MNSQKFFPGYYWDTSSTPPKNMYRGTDVSRGGYVFSKPGMYENVAMLDVNSLHPSSAIAMNYFGDYTPRFKDIMDARLYIKHRNYEPVRHMFDGKLQRYLEDESTADDLAQALKIAINSVYGLTSASFINPFRDSRNVNNIVALRGALFMKTLQDHLTDLGYNVIAIRTDSIKIANATQEAIDICFNMAKEYGYEFEHECTYDRICLVNDAVYIAKYDHYGIRNKGGRHAGEWTATGAQFQQGYVFKKLFSKEELTFDDICETKEVKVGAMYLDMNEGLPEGEHNFQFVGRVGRFCPIKAGCGGGELLVKRDEKYSAVAGTKGYRWLEAEVVKQLSKEDDIDLSYYHRLVDEAIDAISQYEDFEAFVGESGYVSPLQ